MYRLLVNLEKGVFPPTRRGYILGKLNIQTSLFLKIETLFLKFKWTIPRFN